MRNLLTVMKREFTTRLKTKGFIISTILMPVFIFIILFVPALMSFLGNDEQREYVVIDMQGSLFKQLKAALDQKNERGESLYLLKQVVTAPNTLEEMKENQKQEVAAGNVEGLIVLPSNILRANKVEFYSKNVSNFQLNRELRDALSSVLQEKRITQYGIDSETVKELVKRVDLTTLRIGKGGEEKEDKGSTFILTFVMVMFLYFLLIGYGATIMTAVIEEKTSRVVEMLVSSVKPFQLMAGKILGVGSVGLAQFLIWAVTAGLILTSAGALFGLIGAGEDAAAKIPDVGVDLAVYFVLFFMLGYFLYATIYAALGAMVNSSEEGQQLQFPVIMLLVLAIIMLTFVITNPSSTLAITMSLIPFFSPIIMYARIIAQTPPASQIAASLVILVLTIIGLVWVAGKIYRVGILMYGKRPNLPELLRWIRY